MFNPLKRKVMTKVYLRKKLVVRKNVTVLVECNEDVLDDVVVRCRKHSGEVNVYFKTGEGRKLRKLRKLTPEESAQLKAETYAEKEPETSTSTNTTPNINKVTIVDEEPKRQICWRKFRTEISKVGGIDVYMKSCRDNTTIETILLKYPDFLRGIKLYEGGSKGVWKLIVQKKIETVRNIYERYFMDINQFLL